MNYSPVIAPNAFARRLSAVVNEAIEYAPATAPKGWACVEAGLEIELPTEADLAYYDSQAEVMAEQYPQAMAYAKDLPKADNKQYRITLFVAGHDVEGSWSDMDAKALANQLALFSSKGIGYSVEFR